MERAGRGPLQGFHAVRICELPALRQVTRFQGLGFRVQI